MTNDNRRPAGGPDKPPATTGDGPPPDGKVVPLRLSWLPGKAPERPTIWRRRAEGWLNSEPGPDEDREAAVAAPPAEGEGPAPAK